MDQPNQETQKAKGRPKKDKPGKEIPTDNVLNIVETELLNNDKKKVKKLNKAFDKILNKTEEKEETVIFTKTEETEDLKIDKTPESYLLDAQSKLKNFREAEIIYNEALKMLRCLGK